ncbi:hypothetical protein [Roseiflexus sp.]|uniref:hypothetical protein n=1 Tax=Roseiflexus sp. TaxID=2562120 RepID=UPI00398A5F8A
MNSSLDEQRALMEELFAARLCAPGENPRLGAAARLNRAMRRLRTTASTCPTPTTC